MDLWDALQRLGVAIGLGLLVGLQREWVEKQIAGIRTFALISALGAFMALLSPSLGPWPIAAGAIAVAAMLITGNLVSYINARPSSTPAPPEPTKPHHAGQTTEIAALVMYAIGAYCLVGHLLLAVVSGGAVAVLLHYREPLHTFTRRIKPHDISAIMQFVLIALVVLPILPNKAYGPFQVINPHKIWLMVVLIVGMGLVGYVMYELFGSRAGALLGGLLGGLISSTATTASYARRSRDMPASATLAAIVIMIASTVAFVRVVMLVGIVAPGTLPHMAAPLAAMFVFMALLSGVIALFVRSDKAELPTHGNPSDIKAALVFGALYAIVIFAVAATKHYFGNQALYVVASVSGLTDMDAITLSTAQLVQDGRLAHDIGWRLILIAAMSNLIFKAGIAAVVGNRQLAGRVSLLYGIAFALGLGILFFWPSAWTFAGLLGQT